MDFYNENDSYAADWLENLIAAGHLPEGKVDRRSIRDIPAAELEAWRRAHFFAGIGGWPLALHLADWPATEPVWTGSCPCQSFSAAGQQDGLADDRNLWPAWFSQIKERRPDTIFGEQVGNAIGFGWLDGISADLEREGYTVGACLLGAHSLGAPHIRQRLYWVAFTRQQSEGRSDIGSEQGSFKNGGRASGQSGGSSGVGRLGESVNERLERHAGHGNGGSQSRRLDSESPGSASQTGGDGGRLADSTGGTRPEQQYEPGGRLGRGPETEYSPERTGSGFWDRYDLVPCSDGKARRVISRAQLLAAGFSPDLAVLCPTGSFPQRANILRGLGNAIVPQLAAEFIRAFMEIRNAEHINKLD